MSEPAHSDDLLEGAYVDLDILLSLRYRHLTGSTQRRPNIGSRAGIRLAKAKGRGIDFAEVRLYQPGDDIRTIDWRVTARKNKPHTKVFREERERPTVVITDQTQSMFFGSELRLKSVAAAELSAMLTWHTLASHDRAGGQIIGNTSYATHKPYRSTKGASRYLTDLAQFNCKLSAGGESVSAEVLNEALTQTNRMVKSNFRVILISGFNDHLDVWRSHMRSLSRHGEVIAVRMSDKLEHDLPPADEYTVTDGHTRWQFHSGNLNLRTSYHRSHENTERLLEKTCSELAIRYVSLTTADPLNGVVGWL
ncbi:MAG: DUF58 domain-containing protein [Proteobacteria bacterium]|nr:DUF58 domain-containing protein [Pseudomonadota bacterium]